MTTVQHVLRSKGKRKVQPKTDICMVNRIPSEIMIDILSRLPFDSVLECGQVCKPWRNLIRQPSFARLHLSRNGNIYPCHSSVTGAKVGIGLLFYLRNSSPKDDYLVYYGEFDDQPNKKIRRLNQPTIGYLSIASSCNGLICYAESNWLLNIDEPVCISNPITREYMKLPRLEKDVAKQVQSMVCGFGYLPSTDTYKIIKIFYIYHQPVGKVQVYTVGGGSCSGWRDIGETTYSVGFELGAPYHPCTFGAFANGALHWLDNEQNIVSFNLAEEKFYLLPSPTLVGDLNYPGVSLEVQVLGGCLCFIHKKRDEFVDIWFLRKKGGSIDFDVNEQEPDLLTWIKELSLPIDASPIALTESGEFLMWYDSDLCSYDPKTATMETHVLTGGFISRAIPHMNSFVSLESLGGGNCQSRMRYVVNPTPTEYFIEQQRKANGEFDVIQF